MKRTVVLNVVGLTEGLLGEHTPALTAFRRAGSLRHIDPAFPAVTCTAQSNYLTGRTPAEHGIVANGWYHRELAEVQFWKQSNHVVRAPKIWDDLKAVDPQFTCAKTFWWYNMYSTADWSVTPRPMYPADGRKVFDIYTWPYDLRVGLKGDLGEFPFFGFWGPAAGVDSPQGKADVTSGWIAASAKWIEEHHSPTLQLVYLPHLDYNLQRFGPDDPRVTRDLAEIDAIAGDLIAFFGKRGARVIVLSEYGIVPVKRPVHLNRVFREKGWLTIKDELGLELLDAGNSRAFAVADHQAAHIYLNDRTLLNAVRSEIEKTPGVARVLDADGKREFGIDHERAGDLVVLAEEDAWFTYYYWLDDRLAPDFARCVDIHRKPGYDPVELFLDPAIAFPKLRIAWRLLQKKLGFRMLMDVIPLDASLVKGSHGVRPADRRHWPVLLGPAAGAGEEPLRSTEVYGVIRSAVAGA
ncbi:MAG TPA: alkaline phosphatase family protein [Verrucomicrobiales bacterium]|nr:alkaline phosphatase family protein [Verrucomicrobiales bacterium]